MKTKILVVFLAVVSVLASCKKAEKGDMGPAGTNGTNGNANVKAYYYGMDSIMSGRANLYFTFPSEVTSAMVDSSLVLVYHKVSNLWFSSPGFGIDAAYQIRTYTDYGGLNFKSLNPDGTTYTGAKYIIQKIKLVIVPSSDYKGFRGSTIDFNDYYATMRYYNLPLD